MNVLGLLADEHRVRAGARRIEHGGDEEDVDPSLWCCRVKEGHVVCDLPVRLPALTEADAERHGEPRGGEDVLRHLGG
jgi:hypothetical protein